MATRSAKAETSTARRSPSRARSGSDATGGDHVPVAVNEVRLVGRVCGAPEERLMPSGDVLVSLRLVVPREAPTRPRADRPRVTVDTIDVACWSAATRRTALRLRVDDSVEVTGALRRRFYRAGAVALSRYEVEAQKLSRR